MRFSRLENLIGQKQMLHLKRKSVTVFGLGGVGSFAAEALVRSGIGHVTVVDFDVVDQSNINRQLIALESTVGLYKTDVFRDRALSINPLLDIEVIHEKVDGDNIGDLLKHQPDFVLDCIDDVDGKVALVKHCQTHDIPMMLAMGFANKLHPELIEFALLKKTSVCPLARVMRKRLRDLDLSLNVMCVYSKESPVEVIHKDILGSTAFCPSTAGLMMASYVINQFLTEV